MNVNNYEGKKKKTQEKKLSGREESSCGSIILVYLKFTKQKPTVLPLVYSLNGQSDFSLNYFWQVVGNTVPSTQRMKMFLMVA